MDGQDSNWRSASFRVKRVSELYEAMRKAGIAHTKSCKGIERRVFRKARTREEYLCFITRLLNHFRNIYNKKFLASANDPMNALQTLTGATPFGAQGIPFGVHPPGAQMAAISGMAQMAHQINIFGLPQQGSSGMPPHGITGVSAGNQDFQMQLQQMAQQQQEASQQQLEQRIQVAQRNVMLMQQQYQMEVAAAQQQQLQFAAQQQRVLMIQMQQQQQIQQQIFNELAKMRKRE